MMASEEHKRQGADAQKRAQAAPGPPSAAQEKQDYEAMRDASKGGGTILGRMNAAFQDALHTSRGPNRAHDAVAEAGGDPAVTADDLAIRRAKNVAPVRMVVPEGVIINGSMTSGSETEIAGRIEGDVTVDGRLHLGGSALISGNVRATTCRIDGLVEGKVECSEELELGATGRLNGDVLGGRRIHLAGQVFGNVSSAGLLDLAKNCKVTGDIRTRTFVMDEGAVFNGSIVMRPPAKQEG